MKKVADRDFLAFWVFENEQKFRRKRKNAAKSQKFGKNWVSTTTGTSLTKPWNIRMYHHHTSYDADHRFPISNTNRFVIYRCEFYLFLNETVLSICFITNRLSMRKLFLFGTLRNYTFIVNTIASVKRRRNNHLVTPQNKISKKSYSFDFDYLSYERNAPQFSVEFAE